MALLRSEETLMTAEELFRRPDLGPCELVDGRIVPMTPTGDVHGDVESELGMALRLYGKQSKRGKSLVGEVGLYVRRDPDTVRAADIIFISHERYARRGSSAYLDVAPELIVEILSPDDRWAGVTGKLNDYFSAGVNVVWVVDPRLRKVFSYRSLTDVKQFERGQLLVEDEFLPGFSVPVSDLFS
jgi:Uma2 family endonuclease